MSLKTQIAADLSSVFFNTDDFAEAATYTPVSGDAVSCDVLVDHDVLIQADGYDATYATLGTTITAMVADVGTISRGDTFLVDGTTYTVQRPDQFSDDGREVSAVVK
jgi:hypothetical protein